MDDSSEWRSQSLRHSVLFMGEAISCTSNFNSDGAVKSFNKLFSLNPVQTSISNGSFVPFSFGYSDVIIGAFLYHFNIPDLSFSAINTGVSAEYPARVRLRIISSYLSTGFSNNEGFIINSEPSNISVSDSDRINPAYSYNINMPSFQCTLPANRFMYIVFDYTRNSSSLLISYPKLDVNVTAYYI